MRVRRPCTVVAIVTSIAVALLTAFGASAQSSRPPDPLVDALLRGRLVIWILHPPPPQSRLQQVLSAPIQWPDGVQSQPAGSFGVRASDFGVNAASHGQPASTFGTRASDFGQNAASFGQNAASFGTRASDFGQNAASFGTAASNVGQNAAGFGLSLSELNDQTARSLQSNPDFFNGPPHTGPWIDWLQNLRRTFPGLQLSVVDIREDRLQQALDRMAGTNDQPDVVAGDPLPQSWSQPETGLQSQYGLTTLGARASLQPVELSPELTAPLRWQPQMSILRAAQDPDAARALIVWSVGGWGCATCDAPLPVVAGSASDVARQALTGLLRGDGIGSADPEMATFDVQSTRARVLNADPIPVPLAVRVDVMQAESNSFLAVVRMRATFSGMLSFGVSDAFAVLRKGVGGRWLVLQLTPNLAAEPTSYGYGMLAVYAAGGGHLANVGGVSQASPPDGDNRSPRPELWWDNLGGAGLQVVEWQVQNGERSPVSHLFFVPDQGSRLRTRVTATFATRPGAYRWRVWSVGSGGALVLSPWRTLNIIA
jgi:hypothetical protein